MAPEEDQNYGQERDSVDLQEQSTDPVSRFADEFPNEIKRAVDGLNGDVQYAIAYLLIEHGAHSFTQLRHELGVHQQTLSNALNKMQRGSIVTKFEHHNEDEFSSYYSMTNYGRQFIDALFDSLGQGDGQISLENDFVKDPDIQGVVFSRYESVEKYGSTREPVEVVEREVLT